MMGTIWVVWYEEEMIMSILREEKISLMTIHCGPQYGGSILWKAHKYMCHEIANMLKNKNAIMISEY